MSNFYRMLRIVTLHASLNALLKSMFMFKSLWYMGVIRTFTNSELAYF